MINKAFDDIAKSDIEALVANATPERRTIEYKSQLPSDQDEQKREFLSDVSSFANAVGGDLIYGVKDKRDSNGQPTGIPESADGLSGINADREIARLENMIRDGIDERIPGIRLKQEPGFDAGPVIIARIPKSWAGPHMVKFKNLSRFFSRTSAGRYQLDVREIKSAVLASEAIADKINAFRLERIGRIVAGDPAARLAPGAKLILHLLPIQSFAEQSNVDLAKARAVANTRFLPITLGNVKQWGPPRYNFNGLIHCGGASGSTTQDLSYVQLYRNGALEVACCELGNPEVKTIFANRLELALRDAVPRYLELQKEIGIEPPTFIALSIVGTKGHRVTFFTPQSALPGFEEIDSDVLQAPEVLIRESGFDPIEALRPALDTIWQASGWQRSFGYDDKGKPVKIDRVV